MKKKIQYAVIFVIIGWLLLIAFINMFMSWTQNFTRETLTNNFLINIPSWLLMVAIDTTIIYSLNKRLKSTNNLLRIFVDLVTCNLAIFSLVISFYIIIFREHFNDYFSKFSIPILIWNTLMILMIELYIYIQNQSEFEKKLVIIEKEKIKHQYNTLKAQVNPHFLFNCLNILSSLTFKDPEKADLFIKKMSNVYRYLLQNNASPTVLLSEEIQFLENYIYLEKIRFDDNINVEYFNVGNISNKITLPVSLQIIVENSIKHNIATKEKPLFIQINFDKEFIIVTNNIQLRNSVQKSGLGLKNLSDQYAIFGKSIQIRQTKFEFEVTLPYIERGELSLN